jgi:hypothetical protein
MAEMSPLAIMLMNILRKGTIAALGLLVLFTGIFLWQKHTPNGWELNRQDWGFLSVMGFMALLALYLTYAIAKEIKR